MSRIPPELTRTDTRFPDATLFRTDRSRSDVAVADRAISRSRNQRPRWERRYGRTEPPPAAHGRLSRAAFAVTILLLGDRPSPPSGRSPPFSRAKARRERSEEHTSALQSLMRISYAVFCLKKK